MQALNAQTADKGNDSVARGLSSKLEDGNNPVSGIKDSEEDVEGIVRPSKKRVFPVSPLMNPAFHAAREKHRRAKPPPSQEPTEFQKQLAKNPYALALATPVRQCSATLLGLPSFFLQDFNLMSNPTTDDPWYVPLSLSSPHTFPESETKFESLDIDTSKTGSQWEPARKIGWSVYVAFRRPIFQSLFIKKSGFEGLQEKWGKTGNGKNRVTKELLKNLRRAVWRSDMDSFLLELMRRRIASQLLHLSGLAAGYIIECDGWEDVTWKRQVGAVLWMGQMFQEGEVMESEEQEVPPAEFYTLRVGKDDQKVVPVYNLRFMLGKEWVDRLRKEAKVFEGKILVVKHKNMTVELQKKLWRMQGYIATYGDVPLEELRRRPEKSEGPIAFVPDENTFMRSIMKKENE